MNYTYEEIKSLPDATRICGLVLDDFQLDDYFATVALEDELEEKHPPVMNYSEDEISEDSDGYLKVAGDGAAPNGQGDFRLRRSGCGSR